MSQNSLLFSFFLALKNVKTVLVSRLYKNRWCVGFGLWAILYQLLTLLYSTSPQFGSRRSAIVVWKVDLRKGKENLEKMSVFFEVHPRIDVALICQDKLTFLETFLVIQ